MSPRPRRLPALRHVSVRLRVTVDRERWIETYGTPPEELDDAVRRYVVTLIQDSPARQHGAIVSARRAGA